MSPSFVGDRIVPYKRMRSLDTNPACAWWPAPASLQAAFGTRRADQLERISDKWAVHSHTVQWS